MDVNNTNSTLSSNSNSTISSLNYQYYIESVMELIFGTSASSSLSNNSWLLGLLKVYIVSGILFFTTRSYKTLISITSISEIIFCFLTIMLASPFATVILILNAIVRHIINFYLRHFINVKGKVKISLMSGNDAFWAYDEYANSCNFTNYLVMKGNCDLSAIRERIHTNMVHRKDASGSYLYSKLNKRSIKKFGYYCWEEDLQHSFDTNYHVKYLIESAPDKPLTEDQLFVEIQKVVDYPLPKHHPQWQLLLVPHYIYNDPSKASEHYFGLVVRMHHSYMDGISGGSIIQNVFADTPPKLAVDPLKPIRIPLLYKLIGYASAFFLGPRAFFRTLLLVESNCFHGKNLTGPKTLSWSRPISLETLKAIRLKTKTTTTAIFVAATGTALKALANKKQLKIPSLIHGFQTIAMLPYPNLKPHNRFAVALLPMRIGLNSSIERLIAAYKSFKELEAQPDVLISFLTMKFAGLLPRVATKFISDLAHATILISNVPGPCETAMLFNGCELMELSAWAPIRCGIGIGVGFFSYNGKVRACIIADAACCSDPSDVSTMIHEFEKEIIDLSLYSNIPMSQIFV